MIDGDGGVTSTVYTRLTPLTGTSTVLNAVTVNDVGGAVLTLVVQPPAKARVIWLTATLSTGVVQTAFVVAGTDGSVCVPAGTDSDIISLVGGIFPIEINLGVLAEPSTTVVPIVLGYTL